MSVPSAAIGPQQAPQVPVPVPPGLAILVLLFRNKTSINAEDLNTLKG